HVRRATALCRDADVEKYAPTVVADVADIVTKTGAAVVENFLPASDGAASHVDSAAGAIAPRVIDVEASAAAVFQGEVLWTAASLGGVKLLGRVVVALAVDEVELEADDRLERRPRERVALGVAHGGAVGLIHQSRE